MRKMTSLVKNEFVKLFARKSSWMMFILLVVLALGICAISANSYYVIEEEYYYESSWWESEAEWLESEYGKYDPDGEYDESEYDEYYNRNLAAKYRYLVAQGINSYNDWRYPLVEEIFEHKLLMDMGYSEEKETEYYEYLKDLVESDDWESYYADMKDQIIAIYPNASEVKLEAMTFEYTYYIENDLKPGEVLWKDNLISRAATLKKSLIPYLEAEAAGEAVDLNDTEEYRNELAIVLYRLENDIEHDISENMNANIGKTETFWEYFCTSTYLITAIGIMMIVIAGKIVAEEYSGGTIKFLLISPTKRWKILVSKYITVLLMGLSMMVTLYVSSGIFALIFSGGEELGAVVLTASNGVVREISPFIILIKNYALEGVGITVMATMAFAISALMRSTALSVGLGIFSYTSGLLFAELLASMKVDWGRYLIFSNLNLSSISAGEGVFEYQSVGMAIAVIAVHLAVFWLIAWDAFVKRDV